MLGEKGERVGFLRGWEEFVVCSRQQLWWSDCSPALCIFGVCATSCLHPAVCLQHSYVPYLRSVLGKHTAEHD